MAGTSIHQQEPRAVIAVPHSHSTARAIARLIEFTIVKIESVRHGFPEAFRNTRLYEINETQNKSNKSLYVDAALNY